MFSMGSKFPKGAPSALRMAPETCKVMAMDNLIQPQTLKGFRDSLPEQELRRRDLMARLEAAFRSFGYEPIDTPALEYEEILLGKGGGETDKQVYRFVDHGGRRVALRYDLTVPFARFTAQHREELPLPFKRYHIAKVWRGENTQRGRYREFYQCDFDIVGADSPEADAEIVLLMVHSLALAGAPARVHLSDRRILPLVLRRAGYEGEAIPVLRLVDKRAKIPSEDFEREGRGLLGEAAWLRLADFLRPAAAWEDALSRLAGLGPEADPVRGRLEAILERLDVAGVVDRVRPDFSITRGLDYYTGVVFESFLEELPGIGSVCSGGRYDNLAGLYTRDRLPGVGASVGLDRLLAALEELGRSSGGDRCADVAVFHSGRGAESWRWALALRRHGIKADLITEPRKTAQQYTWAEKKRLPVVLIPQEGGSCSLKRLATGEIQTCATVEEAVSILGGWLGA